MALNVQFPVVQVGEKELVLDLAVSLDSERPAIRDALRSVVSSKRASAWDVLCRPLRVVPPYATGMDALPCRLTLWHEVVWSAC